MIVSHGRPQTKHFFREQTVPAVSLEQFAGDWFVQGHTHLWIDRNKPDQLENYTILNPSQIEVNFSFQKRNKRAHFQQKAWVADPQTNAHWHIQFVYPFWSDYLIVGLDPEYQWTLVSVPNRSLMWIMTREKNISSAEYDQLLQEFREKGYPIEKICRVKQSGEEP